MTTEANRQERITWLCYELAEAIDRCERHEIHPRELAGIATGLTSQEEVDNLGDELLQQTFWAMGHVLHRPACWAPTRDEIAYLRRCLREEDLYDPAQIDFIFKPHNPDEQEQET